MSYFYLNEAGQWCFYFDWIDIPFALFAIVIGIITHYANKERD